MSATHRPTVTFDELRPETQRALLRYMQEGVDDGAEFDPHVRVRDFVYIERDEPVEEVKRQILAHSDLADHHGDDFDDYHRWYLANRDVPLHTQRWPALRSDLSDEYFEDGWHRFHSYLAQGAATIPTVELIPADDGEGSAER